MTKRPRVVYDICLAFDFLTFISRTNEVIHGEIDESLMNLVNGSSLEGKLMEERYFVLGVFKMGIGIS